MRRPDSSRYTNILFTTLLVCLSLTGQAADISATDSSTGDQVEQPASTLHIAVKVPATTLQNQARSVTALRGTVPGYQNGLGWDANWQLDPKRVTVRAVSRNDLGRIVVSLPVRVSLKITKRTFGTLSWQFDGCDNMHTRVEARVDVKPQGNIDFIVTVGEPTVTSLTGKCALNVLWVIKIKDLREQVRSGILAGVKAQNLARKLQPLLKQAPSIELLRTYLSTWHRVADASVRADLLGHKIASIMSTKTELRIGLEASIRPQIIFGDTQAHDEGHGDCSPAEHDMCIPLALVLPRKPVLHETVAATPAPQAGFQLIPVSGQELAILRHYSGDRHMNIVFLSGSTGKQDAAGSEVPIHSDNVLAEAASWLQDESRWPGRQRPASLNPLYQQTQNIQALLDKFQFDIAQGAKLSLRNARITMSGLRINSAELRALLQLIGRAELEIDIGQL